MLKTLLLRKKADRKQAEINSLIEELRAAQEESDKVAEAIEEVTEEVTDEQMRDLEETVEETSKKIAELEAKKAELEKELEAIEEEIDSIEEQEEVVDVIPQEEVVEVNERNAEKTIEKRGVNMNNLTTREAIARRLENEQVRDFYSNVADAMLKRGTLTGADLLVPTEVVNAIHVRMENYGSVHKLVRKINLNGNARVIVNAGEVSLFWTEKCASLQEVTLPTLNAVELDNYKLGGYIFLCNATIEDSSIDLAAWIEEEFAKAIANALDVAILSGEGAEQKQPEGITTKVTEVTDVTDLSGALLAGAIEADGEITYVMNQATYTKHIGTKFLNPDANGKFVLAIDKVMPNGAKIVINKNVPADEFIVGDFYNGYVLGVRKEVRFDTNDRLKWVEEQTGFKVSGRYDGKVADATLFARGKFVATPEA